MAIERDEWLLVRTSSAKRARIFFGVPSDRKVVLERNGALQPTGENKALLPVWKVKATQEVS